MFSHEWVNKVFRLLSRRDRDSNLRLPPSVPRRFVNRTQLPCKAATSWLAATSRSSQLLMFICYKHTVLFQWGSSLGQFSFSSDAAVKHFARVFLREEEERGREEEQEESNAGRGRKKILVSFLAFVFFFKKKRIPTTVHF